jgi:hypothetical protein
MVSGSGRRQFTTALGGAAAWPLVARAQQSDRMRRIGLMMPGPENDPEGQANITALREGFEKLRWTIGRNLQIDCRWDIDNVEKTFCVGKKPAISRCKNRPNMSSLSICGLLKRSGWTFPSRCCCSPTR